MADMDSLALGGLRDAGRSNRLSVNAQPSGYVIRSGNKPPFDVILGQALAYFLGVCFVTAGFGLLLLPGFSGDAGVGPMRIGAATLFGSGAAYLLWFSSRGGLVEVQIDTTKHEIREVIQNRVGKPSVVGTYAFNDIGGVYIETGSGAASAQLVLGYRGNMVLVAEGEMEELTLLRTQLSRDLMGPMGLDLTGRPEATRNRKSRLVGRAA